MSRTLKEVRENLLEATEASKTNLQYINFTNAILITAAPILYYSYSIS